MSDRVCWALLSLVAALAGCDPESVVRCSASAECAADHACVRGVCLAECGADASGWDDALSAGLVPVASFCRSADVLAATPAAGGATIHDLTTRSEPGAAGSTRTTLTVSRWTAQVGAAPAPSTVASAVIEAPSEVTLFPGSYLEPSPDGQAVLFGLTLFPAAEGVSDTLFHVRSANGTELAIEAPGNFDAAWLSDETFLVNGLGIGGVGGEQGLYAVSIGSGAPELVQVATGLGFASGSVVVADTHVLVGGFFEGFEGRAYVIERSLVEDVIAGRRAMLDVESEEGGAGVHRVGALPSTFEPLGDAVVVSEYDESFTLVGLRAHPITAYAPASGLQLGESERLTSGSAFRAALPAGAGRLLLVFDGGLLLVE